MLTPAAYWLLTTAATIAIVHTLVGIDHTLPFVVLSRARNWSLSKTLAITTACGLGHLLSSLVLGGLGAVFGLSLARVHGLDSLRGDLAATLLLIFGLAYTAFALVRRSPGHRHGAHTPSPATHSSVLWSLFIVFLLGPCEPLLPLLAAPALANDPSLLILMIATFSAFTLATMLGVVALAVLGLRHINLHRFEFHANALAGTAIALSGLLVLVFGL